MKSSAINVHAQEIKNGINIRLNILPDSNFSIEYPQSIWQKTPQSIRQILVDNLTFATTHFLPVLLQKKSISYNFPTPIFENFFFKNQLYDMIYCEKSDQASHLSYVRDFYNTEFSFTHTESSFAKEEEIETFQNKQDVAIIPFSFGKESLLVVGICIELGIKPVLVYCQEPSQAHEERFKLKQLKALKEEFDLDVHFIKNTPGLFRHAVAFGEWKDTELGWGTQITILNLLMMPFVFAYNASYVFFGSENSNNYHDIYKDWNRFPSFDQTSEWTAQINIMTKLLTLQQCSTKALLESMEVINIQAMLYHRYKNLSKYHSSCFGLHQFESKTAWCGQCYKCEKMFLIGSALGYSYTDMGFARDLFANSTFLDEYFSGYQDTDSDFALYILQRGKVNNSVISRFISEKIPKIKPFDWYIEHFTRLKSSPNLPKKYSQKIRKMQQEEIELFLK